MSLEESMKRQLEERELAGTLRSLHINACKIDFFSNDYLSLSDYITDSSDVSTSPGSSRLIAGTTIEHQQLEAQIAQYFDQESALLFNSGYTANIGVLSSIPKKDDIIFFDELSHASIKDGIRLSLAKGIRFKHNDLVDLSSKLENNKDKRCFVITEGLFSMDGIYSKVKEIDALCKEYNAYLIVDEAHSGGTSGDTGKGLCATMGVHPFITMYTLGKAFGSHGAVVTCNQITKDYLVNFSRPFIYTTALPQSVIFRTSQLLHQELIKEQVERLRKVIRIFTDLFKDHKLTSDPESPIQIYPSENIDSLTSIERSCLRHGIGVKVILPPTVPQGKSCIRISLHANQTKEQLLKLLSIFNQELS